MLIGVVTDPMFTQSSRAEAATSRSSSSGTSPSASRRWPISTLRRWCDPSPRSRCSTGSRACTRRRPWRCSKRSRRVRRSSSRASQIRGDGLQPRHGAPSGRPRRRLSHPLAAPSRPPLRFLKCLVQTAEPHSSEGPALIGPPTRLILTPAVKLDCRPVEEVESRCRTEGDVNYEEPGVLLKLSQQRAVRRVQYG